LITRQTIDTIMAEARIEEVVGDLKKSGASFKALSPFSSEKTPSFFVSPAKGIFKDFSSGKGGNSITFLMEHEQMTYPEALRYLAKKYNITIEEDEVSPEQKEEQNKRESLYIVNEFAQQWFVNQLQEQEELLGWPISKKEDSTMKPFPPFIWVTLQIAGILSPWQQRMLVMLKNIY